MSSRREKVCPICGGLGFVFTENGAKRCRCVFESFNIARYLNIPRRFWDADIKKLRNNLSRDTVAAIYYYLKDFKNFYKEGIGLLLAGPTGVGKTYAVSAILKYIYEKYKVKGFFADTKELSIKLREAFAAGEHTNFIEALSKYPILVLDDLGNEILSDWFRDILVGLISRRYNEKRLTFITTNYYPGYLLSEEVPSVEKELKKHGMGIKKVSFKNRVEKPSTFDENLLLEKRLGTHLVSRLAEMTYPIVVEGLDKRIKKVIK
jgi:DNA replication protein DnaC